MYYEDATLKDVIIGMIFSGGTTGTMNRVIFERIKKRKKKVIAKTIYRMVKEGIVLKEKDLLLLTNKGKVLAEEKKLFAIEQSPFVKAQKKDMILAFDIPEYKRKTRNWLREQILVYGYVMIQKSLWRGPSPLPKSFIHKLSEMGIKGSVKFFRVRN